MAAAGGEKGGGGSWWEEEGKPSSIPCWRKCLLTRKEIQADAACVDLRVRCPYFYELGCKIVPFPARNPILFTLTCVPHKVFESARESMVAFKKWRLGGVRMQKASILGRKRKTKLPDGPSTP
ncbi:hypothetical protein PR202_gb23864 [Eleusine coracana subsp. coracana]|uniref:Uncharacterized protein n=1 Tax=Eleusine coracana subsp. coracana TaxID=191504 RepID=A0AAV5FK21_ELECO|nr:hypothetical protein PR202_gb23864 [Eleusine coracana subsp. coracana]